MQTQLPTLARRLLACGVLACLAAAPAFAQVTISPTPLASGAPLPPNVLFTLDDSGSMNFDYLPDYINDNNTCIPNSGGGTACQRGDPPFEAGGQLGFNGVSYDPNYTYLFGITSTGLPVLNPPSGTLSITSLVPDAYLGGSSVNLNNTSVDRRFCNANGLCKRNGAQDPAVTSNPALPIAAGAVDAQGHAMAAGQFPYRGHASNSSQASFGLPETMVPASFSRSGSTVTVSTSAAHGLSTASRVFVPSPASLAVTCVAVASVPNAFTFTYTTATSGTVGATATSYRACDAGTFVRAASTVTVTTPSPHGLVSNDIVTTFVASGNAMNAASVPVTVSTATSFTYTSGSSGALGPSAGLWARTGLYNVASSVTGYPAAYRITPVEYCSDVNLTTCVEVIPPAAPPAGFNIPAYVRFCKTRADALAPGAVSGNSGTTPRCQLKYVNITSPVTLSYIFPRYGWFTRDSIVSSVLTPSFGNRPSRTDTGCSAGVCSYAAEAQNYAKWYTYYRTRMQMMKTATGRAFQSFVSNPSATPPRPDTLRVGFITIHAEDSGTINTAKYLRISNFNATQASSFYSKFYSQIPNSATPLQEALSRAGWIFAGKLNTGLTAGIPASDDPMQASCQRNFSIFTTDGFWNGNPGQDLSGNAIGNRDNVDNQVIAPYTDAMVSRSTGTYDGNLLPTTVAGTSPGGSGTLADVAMYYYETDLRGPGAGPSTSPNTTPPGGDVATNNVPTKPGNKDFVTHQHMNTYTLGLADGLLRYQADYETSATGDFANIKGGTVGACFWQPGATCNWPSPQADAQTALDDLWHAAVNGRGTFYLALNANALSQGLTSTLNNLNAVIAAAAASATSSPNITQTDNQIFSTTYQTNTWSGRVFAQTIDPITGNVNPTIQWRAEDQIVLVTGSASDTRRIFTANPLNNALMDFTWTNIQANTLTGTERTWFENKCNSPSAGNAFTSPMTQCSSLSGGQTNDANLGSNMIGFLRGQFGNESGPGCTNCIYRDRQELDPVTNATVQTVLGDTIDAKPIFVRTPTFQYADLVSPSYGSFKASMASRPGRLYVGANDGYLHAFDSGTGNEAWAYAPRFLLQGMYRLADTAYSASHRYYVDGSPETGDVFDTTASAWKTIIVGGAAGGGRGYYALDITDANNPKLLWEFCNDSTLCAKSDADLGFSYGNPVIGKRASDGRWVVVLTSGLNNASPGSGGGFFYVLDAITGAQLSKIPTLISGTNVGNTSSPSGLMKISGYYDNALADATFRYVYGGDNLGNIWRMDMSMDPPALLHIATLKDGAGRIQPITTRMALTHIGAFRILYLGTGRYLSTSDLSDPGAASGIAWQQSIYAIKDKDSDYGSNIRVGSNFVTQTLINVTPTTRTTSTLPVDWTVNDGWLIDLNPGNTTPGERVNVDPELILGTLLVASNIPAASAACTVGGDSFLYQFDFKTGQYVNTAANAIAGTLQGGIIVGMAVVQLPSGAIKDIVTTADTAKTSNTVNVSSTSAYLRRFSYRER